jgi:hypothetical protein
LTKAEAEDAFLRYLGYPSRPDDMELLEDPIVNGAWITRLNVPGTTEPATLLLRSTVEKEHGDPMLWVEEVTVTSWPPPIRKEYR